MRTPVFLLLFASAFYAITCKDNGTGPPPDGIDTTSQDFMITTQEFGDGYESAYANDAWVFGPNNIWAVGYFGFNGSYNVDVMQWNGTQWLPRVGEDVNNSSGINSIWALDSSCVYLADGWIIKYKNGRFAYEPLAGFSLGRGSLDHIWPSSESNVWGVGANGCVVRYDGKQWKKIACDSTINFYSITGSPSSGIAYATGWTFDYVTYLVRLAGDSVETLLSGGNSSQSIIMPGSLLRDEDELWVTGAAIRSFRPTTRQLAVIYTPSVYTTPIAMANPNDVFMVGSYYGSTFLFHYNGVRFAEVSLPITASFFPHGISARSGVAVCAGMTNNKAVIITIRRGP